MFGINTIFGSAKSAEKVIDAGIKGLDALVFTEEEKAEYNKKLQDIHLKFVEVSASESTTSSVSRRLICLPVVYSWLALIFISVINGNYGIAVNPESVASAIENMNLPALSAIGFYVGRHMVAAKK